MADAKNEEVVSDSGNTVRPLTQPELEALTADLQAVLVKHSAEMGVTSTINLTKVITTPNEPETTTEAEGAEEEKADNSSEEGS
jgi:hypothetical protein